MTDDTHYPWNEGMPTKPDVDLLLKTWPELEIGQRFDYETVEKILELDREEPRFRTVTNAWRKRLLEKGIVIECDSGKAFFVAGADQVTANTYGTLQSVGKKLRKHRRKLSVVKTETDEQRGIINHQGRLLNEIERQSKKSRMNILPSTQSNDRPAIEPPAATTKDQEQK